jgi:hypothetical protein
LLIASSSLLSGYCQCGCYSNIDIIRVLVHVSEKWENGAIDLRHFSMANKIQKHWQAHALEMEQLWRYSMKSIVKFEQLEQGQVVTGGIYTDARMGHDQSGSDQFL